MLRTVLSAQALLRQQFELIYATAEMNLEGMSREHSLVRPAGGANCANWVLAHLVQVQNGVMYFVGAEPVYTAEPLPRVGLPPLAASDAGYDWDAMKAAFIGSRERCLTAISALSNDDLMALVRDPFGGQTTRAEVLGILANHQPYHIGQLGLLRRIAALPGAIQGPG